MTTPPMFVTTSWDDGHVLDLKVAELLERHGLAGTFYVAPRSLELLARERLEAGAVRSLAGGFEIGGHTLTHRRLPGLTRADAADEISRGKDELEQMLGSRVQSFAYPGGEYGGRDVTLVGDAGFTLARTVQRHVTELPGDPLRLGTTIHAYRHWSDIRAIAGSCDFRPATAVSRFWHWDQLARALFDDVLERGGVFHLWGHSWEIERHRDWERLEHVMAYLGGRTDVTYLTNGELVAESTEPTSER